LLARGHGSFAAHMTVHMFAVAVAAPVLAWALPWRPRLLAAPMAVLAACGSELVVVWGWHAPALHAAARGSPVVFVLEQGSFVLAGYLVWASAMTSAGRAAATSLAGAGALLLTSMHMSLLGGLLAVAPQPWYGHGAEFGTALDDQQLGGVIMLAVGAVAYLSGALLLLARALGHAPAWRGER
jgi:putative membrane protein